jgi:hypothetical protein
MYIIAQAPPAASSTIAAAAATITFNVLAGEPGAGTQVNLNMPGSNRLNGQGYIVRASGNITLVGTQTLATTAATPIQILLCAANSTSFAAVAANAIVSGTAVAAFTQAALTGTTVIPWEVEFQSVGSALLSGVGQGFITDINGKTTSTVRVLSTNVLTNLVMANEPPAQFSVAIVTAVSGLWNATTLSANLTQLVLEA